MIFSPVTAGLYSLMTLGKMGVAFISIFTRTIELVARITAPVETPQDPPEPRERRHTLGSTDLASGSANAPGIELVDMTPEIQDRGLTRSNSAPISPPPSSRPVCRTNTSGPQSPEEQLQQSPIVSTFNVTRKAIHLRRLRESSVNANIDVNQELPHRMHTRAIIAGAIAIHVPKRFERLLRSRNWEQLSDIREISTEHLRIPESDCAFEEFNQYILPPTAVVLDNTLRIYPESSFRDAAAGLLQLGFGLYQLISSDARFSVERDGLASPFLIVLPYLGMAAINTTINILDPPYPVVTVLDVSYAIRRDLINQRSSLFSSPTQSPTGYFRPRDTFSDRNFPLRLPEARRHSPPSTNEAPGLRIDTSRPLAQATSLPNGQAPPLVQSSTTLPPSPFWSPNVSGPGTWQEFIEWIEIAYEKRIDVSPVDRLYKRKWIVHSIIIGEFIYTTAVGLLIPLVILAVAGGWTRFRTSNYGLSLTFNLLALFGLPFIQFVLYTHHLFFRVKRDLTGRERDGTFYSEPNARVNTRSEREQQRLQAKWTKIKRRSSWWDTIAQSVGLYFPARRSIIVAYATFVVGVAVCEFTFVGINLQRTLSCQGSLI